MRPVREQHFVVGCAVWVVVCVFEREGDGEREMIQEKCDLGEVVRERWGQR